MPDLLLSEIIFYVRLKLMSRVILGVLIDKSKQITKNLKDLLKDAQQVRGRA